MNIDRLADDVVYRLMEKVACDAELQQMLKQAGFFGDIGNWAKKNVLAPAALAGTMAFSPMTADNAVAKNSVMYEKTKPALEQLVNNPTKANAQNFRAEGVKNNFIQNENTFKKNYDYLTKEHQNAGGFIDENTGKPIKFERSGFNSAEDYLSGGGALAALIPVGTKSKSEDTFQWPNKKIGAGHIVINDTALSKRFSPAILDGVTAHEGFEAWAMNKYPEEKRIDMSKRHPPMYTNPDIKLGIHTRMGAGGYSHYDPSVLALENNYAMNDPDYKNIIQKLRSSSGETEAIARTAGSYDKGWMYDDNFRMGEKPINMNDPKMRDVLADNLANVYGEAHRDVFDPQEKSFKQEQLKKLREKATAGIESSATFQNILNIPNTNINNNNSVPLANNTRNQ